MVCDLVQYYFVSIDLQLLPILIFLCLVALDLGLIERIKSWGGIIQWYIIFSGIFSLVTFHIWYRIYFAMASGDGERKVQQELLRRELVDLVSSYFFLLPNISILCASVLPFLEKHINVI